MSDILDLARPDIRALQPYSSARMEARGGSVLLNANESPWPAVASGGGELNRYPDPQPAELIEAFASLYGVTPHQVLAGRGSDEAIDLLVRAFCRAGQDAVVICPPTFGMYAVSAGIQGATVIDVPLADDFALDADAVIRAAKRNVKIVFLCSPNNPTGNLVPLATIRRIAAALQGRSLVVVDEAYIEFAGTPSAATVLGRHDNLAVLRTLSKAHALAAARIGVLLAHADIVALLRRILPAYPLPAPCVDAALAALTPPALAATRVRVANLVAAREQLQVVLPRAAAIVGTLPSSANFVVARCRDPQGLYVQLLAAGVVVRNVTHYRGLDDCLRISVGSPSDHARLFAALGLREEAA
jgi:histidinol-phosphate aminotransferase